MHFIMELTYLGPGLGEAGKEFSVNGKNYMPGRGPCHHGAQTDQQ